MEILKTQSNDEGIDDKKYAITVYLRISLYASLQEYYSSLCLEGNQTFTCVGDIIKNALKKIKEDGYKKYIKGKVKKRTGVDYINTYKNLTIRTEKDIKDYWKSIPHGIKSQLLEVVLYKFMENRNFDY